MKVQSEGKLVLEIDEDKIREASQDESMYRFEMLKETTKTATLMEVSVADHRELRDMIADNKTLLVRIAMGMSILLTIILGTTVVV